MINYLFQFLIKRDLRFLEKQGYVVRVSDSGQEKWKLADKQNDDKGEVTDADMEAVEKMLTNF